MSGPETTWRASAMTILAAWLVSVPEHVDRFDRMFVAVLVSIWVGPDFWQASKDLWNGRRTP